MFIPKTERIKKIFETINLPIKQLEDLFIGNTSVYIDYANVRPWSVKLGWNVDPKRLKQFLMSFDNIKLVKLYDGTLESDVLSKCRNKEFKSIFKDGYKTKPVKIMRHSIDYTSIKPDETSLLDQFVRRCLIMNYDIRTIVFLNERFKEMNQRGIYYIEDRKCNFDVEIGRDILLDFERNHIDTYVLWSGDSDFYDPIKQLLIDGKKVILFATAGRVAKELNDLVKDGLIIFEIKKIREFICWKEQI